MPRDDFFTLIHKALRKELFDVAVLAGATDWDDPAEVRALVERWSVLHEVLVAHTQHEDDHLLRILATKDPHAIEPALDQHRDLDDLLADLQARAVAALECSDAVIGLAWYRDLNRFIGAYLPHLHDEETRIMGRIWERCTDDELAATRAAFMAAVSPDLLQTSARLMLAALNGPERALLLARVAAPAH